MARSTLSRAGPAKPANLFDTPDSTMRSRSADPSRPGPTSAAMGWRAACAPARFDDDMRTARLMGSRTTGARRVEERQLGLGARTRQLVFCGRSVKLAVDPLGPRCQGHHYEQQHDQGEREVSFSGHQGVDAEDLRHHQAETGDVEGCQPAALRLVRRRRLLPPASPTGEAMGRRIVPPTSQLVPLGRQALTKHVFAPRTMGR